MYPFVGMWVASIISAADFMVLRTTQYVGTRQEDTHLVGIVGRCSKPRLPLPCEALCSCGLGDLVSRHRGIPDVVHLLVRGILVFCWLGCSTVRESLNASRDVIYVCLAHLSGCTRVLLIVFCVLLVTTSYNGRTSMNKWYLVECKKRRPYRTFALPEVERRGTSKQGLRRF